MYTRCALSCRKSIEFTLCFKLERSCISNHFVHDYRFCAAVLQIKSAMRSPPPPHPPAVSVKTTLDASKHSCVSCGCNSSTSTPLCKESRKAANFSLQDSVLGFKNNPICAVYVSLFFFQSFCTCSIIFRLCKAPSPVPASSTPVPVSYTRVPASSTQVPSEFHPSSRQFHPSSSQFHPN